MLGQTQEQVQVCIRDVCLLWSTRFDIQCKGQEDGAVRLQHRALSAGAVGCSLRDFSMLL